MSSARCPYMYLPPRLSSDATPGYKNCSIAGNSPWTSGQKAFGWNARARPFSPSTLTTYSMATLPSRYDLDSPARPEINPSMSSAGPDPPIMPPSPVDFADSLPAEPQSADSKTPLPTPKSRKDSRQSSISALAVGRQDKPAKDIKLGPRPSDIAAPVPASFLVSQALQRLHVRS